jgi:hypothetical protein
VIRSGVANNGTYTIGVRAVTSLDGVTYTGPVVTSAPVAPYGPPNTPGASATSGDTTVTLNWSAPARNGQDFHLEISVDGGGWQNVGASGGSTTVGNGYSQTHSIAVRTVDAVGQTSATASASATSAPPPAPSASVSKGGSASPNPGNWVNLSYANINGTYTVKFWSDQGGVGVFWTETVKFTGSSAPYQTNVFYGYPGSHVWVEIVGVTTSPQIAW